MGRRRKNNPYNPNSYTNMFTGIDKNLSKNIELIANNIDNYNNKNIESDVLSQFKTVNPHEEMHNEILSQLSKFKHSRNENFSSDYLKPAPQIEPTQKRFRPEDDLLPKNIDNTPKIRTIDPRNQAMIHEFLKHDLTEMPSSEMSRNKSKKRDMYEKTEDAFEAFE